MVCDWQQAASSVLVAVGKRFIGKVMEELLSKFQPGALPHYFVVQTLANLAASNGRYCLARLHLHFGASREGLSTMCPRHLLPFPGTRGAWSPGQVRQVVAGPPSHAPVLQCLGWCPS